MSLPSRRRWMSWARSPSLRSTIRTVPAPPTTTRLGSNEYGSKPAGDKRPGEPTDGPNFNVRKESRDDVLFAIRNGGFSGAIMPANVVVGKDAEAIADFLSKYSGKGG